MVYALLSLLSASAAAQPFGPAGFPIIQEGTSDYVIVLSATAPPADRRGAAELQKHLAMISGVELPIVADDRPAPAHGIMIGMGRLEGGLDAGKLGGEGFVIRTRDKQVFIAGAGPRGTMYGCSAFLEGLGVRWFTPKVTVAPKQATVKVKPVEVIQSPAFEYREPFFFEAFDKEWAARNRVNGHSARLDDSTGGKVEYAQFVHTFDAMIPPALHAPHPEYFPLINGGRADGYVQRCLTNPDVLKLAIEGVKRSFRENPRAGICSVSQNDCGAWCTCDACAKLTQQYGAHSGLYLWFVNQVAEAVEKDFPDKLIDTLAYQFTEAPPTGIVPRKNVRVRLCPIAVCESHPYEHDDFPATRAFVANLAAWGKITDTLYIWHYNTDFAHYLMPFPDFAEFPTDLRLYKKSGVKGIFFQGAYADGGGGSDSELRAWVMARLLWDPNLISDDLVTEWMRGVYGPAWRPMRSWFDLLHERFGQPGVHLGIYDPPKPETFTPDLIAKGDALFDEAEKLAAEPLQREYVDKARLGLRYVKLALRTGTTDELNAFIADLKRLGVTSLSEGRGREEWEDAYRARIAAPR